jgi:hypothetical protein
MYHVQIDRHATSPRGHVKIEPQGACVFTLAHAQAIADLFAQERIRAGWDWKPDAARLNGEAYAADVWDGSDRLRYHVLVRPCTGLRGPCV